jgi:hypothetical protein
MYDDGTPPSTTCKIHHIGNYYYAFSGHFSNEANLVITKVLLSSASTDWKYKMLGDSLKILYQRYLGLDHQVSNYYYKHFLNKPLASIAFIYSNAGKLTMDGLEINIIQKKPKSKFQMSLLKDFRNRT